MLVAIILASAVTFYLLHLLFSYAIFGGRATISQRIWIVFLSWPILVGVNAFNSGTISFSSRIANPPNLNEALVYLASAAVAAGYVAIRGKPSPPGSQGGGIAKLIWRGVAVLLSAPLVIIGIGNVTVNLYNSAGFDPNADKLGAMYSYGDVRDHLLGGEMAPFWRGVESRSPEEFEYIVGRLQVRGSSARTLEEGVAALNSELTGLRVRLSEHSRSLTDEARKEILKAQRLVTVKFADDPVLCANVIQFGSGALTVELTDQIKDLLLRLNIIIFDRLTSAKNATAGSVQLIRDPNEGDYVSLRNNLVERGFSDDDIQIAFVPRFSHRNFCKLTIEAYKAIEELGEPSGPAIRKEITHLILSGGK